MRRLVTFVLAVALGTSLSACGSSSLSGQSPRAVRAAIVAAALAQKSVHWTEISRPHMAFPTTFTSDVNAGSGTERISVNSFVLLGGKAQLRLVNHIVYVRGNPVGLRLVLGLTKARAEDYAGKWISIPRGDKLYTQTADGLTLASIIHDWTPRGRVRVDRWKSHGIPLLELRSDMRSADNGFPQSLSALASGDPLPTTYSEATCIGCSVTGAFSKWNEPVRVQAPSGATPIAVVRGDPKGVLASIVAAALAQKSVHLTASVSEDLFGTTTYTVDVNRDSAVERVKYGGGTMHLLVFRHAVYLRGDALLLEERLGLSQGQARRYADKWIWVPRTRGDKLYDELADGLTLNSIVRRAARMTNLKLSRGTSPRSNFVVVRGTPTNSLLPVDELSARANGAPLPVAFSGFLPGVSTSGRFSTWNEPVEVRLPESSTPIAVVRGS